MKILVCIGSGRKKGNTDQFIGLVREELERLASRHGQTLEIETLYLGQLDLQICRGCRVCFDAGENKCPLRDDLLAVKAKMKAADGLLVASPVYVNDVSALIKNWIDRLAHVCHRPEFGGKSAYLVATVGSTPTRHSLETMQVALSTWGYQIAGMSGIKTGALMQLEEMRARFQGEARRVAQKLLRAVEGQSAFKPSFYSLMMFKIQQIGWQRASRESIDHAYWHDQGWLETSREYFIAHQSPAPKVWLARLTGAILAKFVT